MFLKLCGWASPLWSLPHSGSWATCLVKGPVLQWSKWIPPLFISWLDFFFLMNIRNWLPIIYDLSTEKWNIFWHINKQGLQPSDMSQWTLRELRKEKKSCHLDCSQLPASEPWGKKAQGVKTEKTGPTELRCISKEWFQGPRTDGQTFASSHIQK
jgi:hypothetical protein